MGVLRPPPQAHGLLGGARAWVGAGQPSARADTLTPEGGRDQDLGKGVQTLHSPSLVEGPLSYSDLNQVGRGTAGPWSGAQRCQLSSG